jgi:activator of HSP90 ATPase
MHKTIRQTVDFNLSPHQVYEALIDSRTHSRFTGSKADISRQVGGKFTAYGGSLTGENLELVPDQKIVQTWQPSMAEWPRDHYSKLTITLAKNGDSTQLSLVQEGVPAECFETIDDGWRHHYWQKMKKTFRW